jgi:hypothetical protein
MLFNFDNSKDVGCIDEYITDKFFNQKDELYRIKLNIQNELTLDVYKYKNEFPLVLNKIKAYFKVPSLDYNIATIEGVKYLVYESLNNIPLKDYKLDVYKSFSYYKIRQIIAINHLLCINSNYEKNIYVFSNHFNPNVIDMPNSRYVSFKTIKEKTFKYDIIKHEISKSILDKWFNGSLEEFRKTVKDLADEINPEPFNQEMLKICRIYNDDKFIYWTNSVYNKIIEAKGY